MKVLLVSDDCPACKIVKQQVDSDIRLVNFESEEGHELASKLNIDGVPECIIVDVDKNESRVCTDSEWREMFK